MSKLLKRTLALSLIFCLILSVIPAVSADEPAQPTTISLSFGDLKGVSFTATAAKEYGTRSWCVLKSSATPKFNTSGNLELSANNTAHWYTLLLKVETPGFYNWTVKYNVGNNNAKTVRYCLLKADALMADGVTTYKTSIASKGQGAGFFNTYTANADNCKVNTTVNNNHTYSSTGVSKGHRAYLGNVYLEAGEYIIGVQGIAAGSSTRCYSELQNMAFTPGTDGSDFLTSIMENNTNDAQQIHTYQLAANLSAPDFELTMRGQELDLRGYKLTVGSVAQKSVQAGVKSGIADSVGGGQLLADSIKLPTGQQQLPVTVGKDTETDKNIYKFTTVTQTIGTALKDRPGAEEGTKSFGFDVGLLAAAYGWDLSSVTVKVEAFVIGQETAGAECVYSAENIADWKAAKATTDNAEDDRVFYVDIANYELLADEVLTFRVTVSSNSKSFTTEVGYQNSAILAA